MSGTLSADPWFAYAVAACPDAAEEIGQIEPDNGGGTARTSALAQAHAIVQVDSQKSTCESDTGGPAVMAAMILCGVHGIPVPAWLWAAFLGRALTVTHAHVKSWEDPRSFGRAWPKGTRLAQVRQNRRLMTRVHDEVLRLVTKDNTVTLTRASAFDAVSRLPGIGKSASGVEALYYRARAAGLQNAARTRAIAKEQQSLAFGDWTGTAAENAAPRSTLNPEKT